MALTSEGRVYTWGHGEDGKLGHGSESNHCPSHVLEGLMGYKVVHITSHSGHSAALIDGSKQSYATMVMKSMIVLLGCGLRIEERRTCTCHQSSIDGSK